MILNLIILVCFTAFFVRRLLTYLHVFQQDEYDPKRFWDWLVAHKAYDKRASLWVGGFALIAFLPGLVWFGKLFMAGAFAYFAYKENNPLKNAKKTLVLTNRAKGIAIIAFVLIDTLALAVAFTPANYFLWVVLIQLIPLSLMTAVKIRAPLDQKINARFRVEADQKLRQIDPFIIGITGSFGKTSVKYFLSHILQNQAPTLMTPGSVNTEMGITRIIREQLGAHHKYFIVEMGAYGIGSIERLCNFTKPKLSILTAVGGAHLERFKDLNDTAKAKLEIAAPILEQDDSVLVLHQSVLEQPYAQSFYDTHKAKIILCGETGDIQLKKAIQTATGLEIGLTIDGKTHQFKAPIYGLHHADNIMLAVAAAHKLGMSLKDIAVAVSTLPQVKHRLEVKEVGNYTLIDDAYNSNPKGFAAGLDLLDLLAKEKGGRRILITPGMVELGESHDKEHSKLGLKANDKVDIAVLIQPQRIQRFVDTFKGQEVLFDRFEQAQSWLAENIQANDVVLIENDLPDLYERQLSL
jgi:UDP-N-acetylmuramoyl-tripeptide--D-alanyl-D-alanine ligase